MSSLRNAVKRITHKERDQPQNRKHLGILEKKQDYKVRAKDYHRKEDRINALRQRASMRNPDEFYFGMKNAEIRDGKHRKTQQAKQKEFEAKIGTDTVRIMKDQDLSYVRMQKQQDAKKLERLQSSLHFLEESTSSSSPAGAGVSGRRQHTIFLESVQEAEQFNVAQHFETIPELASRSFNRPRVVVNNNNPTVNNQEEEEEEGNDDDKEQVQAGEGGDDKNQKEVLPSQQQQQQQLLAGPTTILPTNTKKKKKNSKGSKAKEACRVAKKIAKARSSAYAELEARSKRIHAMELAELHLVNEKLVASKGRKRKIKEAEDGKPPQYKWRRMRQG